MPPLLPSTAHIALGTNLGDRAANLREALVRLGTVPGVRVVRISSFLENPAVGGPADAPPFLNAAAEVETSLDPHALLGRLLAVERAMGRERRERWGPRVIDLDLVLFGDQVVDAPDLKVPHPLMHERPFVLAPLAEIAPDARHPALGRTVGELAAEAGRVKSVTGVPPVLVAPGVDNAGQTEVFGAPRRSHGRDARDTDGTPAAPRLALTLRPATNADGPAIRDLVFAVLREYGLTPDPCGADLDLTDVEGHYPRRGGRLDVLVDAAGIVRGTVGLAPAADAPAGGPRTCELRKMYLHRTARGRGWGRRLLDHALAEARRMGFGRVTLETATPLVEAVGLYRAYGFSPYAAACRVTRCDQVMELRL